MRFTYLESSKTLSFPLFRRTKCCINMLTLQSYCIEIALLLRFFRWLRLFAFVLAPVIALYFVTVELLPGSTSADLNRKQERRHWVLLMVGLASSLVLTTDTFYVHNYDGRQRGAGFFFLFVMLFVKRGQKFKFYKKGAFASLVGITALTAYLITHSGKVGDGPFDHPGIDVPTTKPGFYYARNNTLMSKVAELWPEHKRTYDENNGTPYLPTGDARTGKQNEKMTNVSLKMLQFP